MGEEQRRAFKELRQYLSNPPVLSSPEIGEIHFMYLVVSILFRKKDKKQKPVFYTNQMLLDVETRYSHLEKLILALVNAKLRLRHYCKSHAIIVLTNQPLKVGLTIPDLWVDLPNGQLSWGSSTLNSNHEQQRRDNFLPTFWSRYNPQKKRAIPKRSRTN